MPFDLSETYALKMDQQDPLRFYRDRFHLPKGNKKESIYFVGNSLGLQPKTTRQFLDIELQTWEELGVDGHFQGKNPWFHYHKFTKELIGRLVGAKPSEVVSMNNLTSNLHLMLISFYRPDKKKIKIITEADNFPSDQLALESHIRYHHLDPQETLIELKPRKNEFHLRTEDICESIEKIADELALVMMSGVHFYTGQFFNLDAITTAGHNARAYVGFDLAHAVGNVPLQLHNINVDFAVWCSYKYLNSGPGGVAGTFVHERHGNNLDIPRLAGWWGHNEDERFQIKKGFNPMFGADGWQLSNVNILSTASHWAALKIFDEAGIDNLRNKSIKLTGYLEFLLNELKKGVFEIITPKNPEERGCQLSLFFFKTGKRIFNTLAKEGVVADWREPNVIRVSPVPLYNSFSDVYRFYQILKKSLGS